MAKEASTNTNASEPNKKRNQELVQCAKCGKYITSKTSKY